MSTPIQEFVQAVTLKNAATVRQLLQDHQDVRDAINEPLFSFDSRAVHAAANNMPVLDVLLEFGADINAPTDSWAGGFSVFDWVELGMVDELIERGGILTPHGAARHNRVEALGAMLGKDSSLANVPGGDGQRPLHVAGSTEVIDLLLKHGAELDARDIDHEATPAQYLVDRPELCRHLVARGARTDLLMACALGDVERARQHLEENPASVCMRVDETWFPKEDPRAGGHIYNWKLGFYRSAFQVARTYGHRDVLAVLHEFATPEEALLDAIWSHEEANIQALRAAVPSLSPAARRQIADAAFHNNTETVKLFLLAGFPVDVQGHNEATPLHWAAHHGNAEMVQALLAHKPPLNQRDGNDLGTPVGWCLWGAAHRWPSSSNRYEEALKQLLEAGATVTASSLPTGDAALDSIIRDHLRADV